MDGSSEGLWQGRVLIILVNLMHLQRHNEGTRNVYQTIILFYHWCLAESAHKPYTGIVYLGAVRCSTSALKMKNYGQH